jgi:hypothetical protein
MAAVAAAGNLLLAQTAQTGLVATVALAAHLPSPAPLKSMARAAAVAVVQRRELAAQMPVMAQAQA